MGIAFKQNSQHALPINISMTSMVPCEFTNEEGGFSPPLLICKRLEWATALQAQSCTPEILALTFPIL